jgi:hypothetical protein
MTDQIDYGYEELRRIPDEMAPWEMNLVLPPNSIWDGEDTGKYVLVGVDQASIELHHQVEVLDENGNPLADVWVIFGFPGGGPDLGRLNPKENYWPGAPAVLMGNAQKTSLAGYAQHTFKTGGEDIWVWDLDDEGVLKLPSPIVKNCKWTTPPVGWSNHTGVRLRFQRRRDDIVPEKQQLADLEARVAALEAQLGG